jgi:hypothetical protein
MHLKEIGCENVYWIQDRAQWEQENISGYVKARNFLVR